MKSRLAAPILFAMFVVLCGCSSFAGGFRTEAATLAAAAQSRIEAARPGVIAFRRDLHRYPELSGEEVRTAGRIAQRLENLGFSVRRNVGGQGVIGVLEGARAGRVVAFRADMDAVRSDAPDPAPFASQIEGVRHICGHDVHVAIGIALAEGFAAIKSELPGTVVLIFQPAEETARGARLMVEQGALTAPYPDAIFAYHTSPYQTGQIAYSEGLLMTSRDAAQVRIAGGADARALAHDLARELASIGDATEASSYPLGADFVRSEVSTPRQDSDGAWHFRAVFSLASETARARTRVAINEHLSLLRGRTSGARIELDYEPRWVPGVVNDAVMVRRGVASIRAELGEASAIAVQRISPAFSEDFGHMLEVVPGAMFYLGVGNREQGWSGMPHSPDYVADEEAIFVGARAMTRIMLDVMTLQH